MTDRLTGALIAPAAEEPGDLVLQRLLQNQPGTETPDRLDRVLLAADTGQHLIQLGRNLSLGATFSMRAYLHRLVLSGQSGGYARNFKSPGS